MSAQASGRRCRWGRSCGELTFFWSRTTLVHFFSSSPSYFLDVAASKLSPMLASALRAAAASWNLLAERYAIIDLWLGRIRSRRAGGEGKRGTHSSSAWRLVSIWLIVAGGGADGSTKLRFPHVAGRVATWVRAWIQSNLQQLALCSLWFQRAAA